MGRVKNNTLKDLNGTVGNLIFYSIGQKQYVRARPISIKDAKSPAQLAQRQRMAVTQEFLQKFKAILRYTFPGEKGKRDGFFAAKSYNLKHGLVGEYPAIAIDIEKALISRGPLPVPEQASYVEEGGFLQIDWQMPADTPETNWNDQLLVVAHHFKTQQLDYLFSGARRKALSFRWKPELNFKAGEISLWLAFRDKEETLMSDSVYVE